MLSFSNTLFFSCVRCRFIKGEFGASAKSVDLSSAAQKMNSGFCSGRPPGGRLIQTLLAGISGHVGMCRVFTILPTKV